ncbi:hypothetical protein GCM10028808_02930 [Spirosoma migulaei]
MRTSITPLVIALGFLVSLFACSDHRLGGSLSPVRLRLKTVAGGGLNTTYTYDSQNRLASISKADGSLGIISYGDPDHKYSANGLDNTLFVQLPNPADQTTGAITLYPRNLDGTTFSATKYSLVNSRPGNYRFQNYQYTFDANRHISTIYSVDPNVNPSGDFFTFTYTGENITRGAYSYVGGHFNAGVFAYEYDDKINPFFGLLDPDIDPLDRFSRNNRVKSSSSSFSNTPVTTYEYEYSSQGLPTKRTTKQDGTIVSVLTYTYESY